MNCTTTKKIKLALLVYNSYYYLLLNFASLWSTFHSNLAISQLLLARLTSLATPFFWFRKGMNVRMYIFCHAFLDNIVFLEDYLVCFAN